MRPAEKSDFDREDGTWSMVFFSDAAGAVRFKSLGVELLRGELYAGVEFPAPTKQTPLDPTG